MVPKIKENYQCDRANADGRESNQGLLPTEKDGK
jgi:hypothetical protein